MIPPERDSGGLLPSLVTRQSSKNSGMHLQASCLAEQPSVKAMGP